jgi:hypothetical protein
MSKAAQRFQIEAYLKYGEVWNLRRTPLMVKRSILKQNQACFLLCS